MIVNYGVIWFIVWLSMAFFTAIAAGGVAP